MEEHGGPDALKFIKFSIPLCKSLTISMLYYELLFFLKFVFQTNHACEDLMHIITERNRSMDHFIFMSNSLCRYHMSWAMCLSWFMIVFLCVNCILCLCLCFVLSFYSLIAVIGFSFSQYFFPLHLSLQDPTAAAVASPVSSFSPLWHILVILPVIFVMRLI